MHQYVAESVYLNRCKNLFATTKNSVEKSKNRIENGPISSKSKNSTSSRNIFRDLQLLNVSRSYSSMDDFVAENVYLNHCKKCSATTINSVEKEEKPICKCTDFLKVEQFDLIKKPFQGPTALKC